MSPPAGTTVVGTGKLSRALLRALALAGDAPLRVVSRRGRRASRVAAEIAGVVAVPDALDAAGHSRVTILAVPDAALREMAADWARRRADWSRRVVLHCAGALGPDALAPLRRAGAAVGVLHPFQALGDPKRGGEILRGAWARIDGSPPAVRAARRIAMRIGLRPIRFRAAGADPAAYHASASLASNDVLALLALAERTLVDAGARGADARAAVATIARSVVDQFALRGIGAATGPVVRGDADTVERHGAALTRIDPGAAEVHALLGRWMLEHAASLPEEARRRVERALRRGRRRGAAV